MLDVAEKPGIALNVPKAQTVKKGLPRATHCTDRAQTSGNVIPRTESCPPPLTFRITLRARTDMSKNGGENHNSTDRLVSL